MKLKIITIANNKVGVGKTTFIFNLAHYLESQGKKVLLVDLDIQQQNLWYIEANRSESLKFIDNLSQNIKLNEYGRYRANYDYVLIDTPPHIDEVINHAFLISDSVLLISDISQTSLNGILKIYDRYNVYCKEKKIKNNINGIILNNLNNNKTTKMFVEHIESNDKIKDILLKPYIPHWTVFQNTTILAKSLNEMKNNKAQGIFEKLINDLKKKEVL